MFRIETLPPDEACLAVFGVFPRIDALEGQLGCSSDLTRAGLTYIPVETHHLKADI